MKLLMTADMHLDMHKGSPQRLDDGLEVLQWTAETALEKECDFVFILGDLFQNRQKIHVLTYQRVFQTFVDYPEVNWKILLGNHDLWYSDKWDVSSVQPLNSLPNVEVIGKPMSMNVGGVIFDWLPFVKNPIHVIKEYFDFDRTGRVLLGHIAVDGARLSRQRLSDVSVEFEADMVRVAPTAFAGWRRIFLGHYHLAQFVDERMEYLGSPYQINFSEVDHTPHLVLFDTESLTTEYVENTFSPRHLIVDQKDIGSINLENNFVQVRGNLTQFDEFEIAKELASNVRSLEFKAYELKKEEDKPIVNFGNKNIVENYIDTVNKNGLSREILVATALEILTHGTSQA